MNKKVLLLGSLVLSSIFTGCFTKPNPSNPLEISRSSVSVSDEINGNELNKMNKKNSFDSFIGKNADNLNNDTYLSAEDIIKVKTIGDVPPIELTSKRIDKMEMYSSRLGDLIRLILNGINVNLTIQPNVNLNTPSNIKINNKSIWESLKQVCESSGYNIYYDATKKSLILSPYVVRKYYVPSEIFIKRKVSIGLTGGSSAGGSINPSFDINPPDPISTLKSTIDMVGSKDKIVSIDTQAGIIYLKERLNYVREVDDAIKTFVQERSVQFQVQLVVAELNLNQMKQFGMDIADISNGKIRVSSLGGSQINDNSLGNTIGQGGVVVSGFSNYANINGVNPVKASKMAYKMMLSSLKTMNNVQIVERPNVIVQNHSIGYISVGDDNSYIKSVTVTPGKQNADGSYTAATYQYNIGNYTDGLQFVVRIDKYLHKDRIGVSLAPILAYTKVVQGPQDVQLLQRKIRQAMSVVSIKDGDIIVLGGMKSLKGTGSGNDSGILPTLFGMKSSDKQQVETLFIVRVQKINHASDTKKFMTPTTRDLVNSVKIK